MHFPHCLWVSYKQSIHGVSTSISRISLNWHGFLTDCFWFWPWTFRNCSFSLLFLWVFWLPHALFPPSNGFVCLWLTRRSEYTLCEEVCLIRCFICAGVRLCQVCWGGGGIWIQWTWHPRLFLLVVAGWVCVAFVTAVVGHGKCLENMSRTLKFWMWTLKLCVKAVKESSWGFFRKRSSRPKNTSKTYKNGKIRQGLPVYFDSQSLGCFAKPNFGRYDNKVEIKICT